MNHLKEKFRFERGATGMEGMRGAKVAEGSSNNISEALKVAQSPLAIKGTQVCEERGIIVMMMI